MIIGLQLDVTCRKTTKKPCMGGCIWGLSVWMWERLPVGRPEKHPSPHMWVGLNEEDDVFRLPTVAFSWDRVRIFGSKNKSLYKNFINEMDSLTYRQVYRFNIFSKLSSNALDELIALSQVNWRPYEANRGFTLNQMCTRDSHLWRIRCPLICIYAVEWHLPHRVAMQFGMRQRTPPEPASTGGLELHK